MGEGGEMIREGTKAQRHKGTEENKSQYFCSFFRVFKLCASVSLCLFKVKK